jgi:F-type H+-transporting ATPase subunit delta
MELRGASADSLEKLRSELVDAVSGRAAGALGDELFVVAKMLRREGALRRLATDASQQAKAKQDLVANVLGGRVGDATVSIVSSAVAERWTLSRDLPDALERLSEVAAVKSAGDDGRKLVDELFEVGQLITASPELRDALSNPARSTDDRATLVEKVLDGKVLPATVTLTKQALAGTYHTVTQALATYRKVAASVADETVATLRVVAPLGDREKKKIADILSRQYGTTVHVNEVIDPEVMGGVHVAIGDDVIDGTIANRVAEARRLLVG